jgi:type VI protein secretion system component VasK
VQQGGASEPSIQLAGGTPRDQTSHDRDTANQMLDTTRANLKKIAGTQLTSNQQDMVNQIHQFMDQSKAAVDAGDLDRARTLAWKAQLLSEELVKPEK